MNRVYHLPVCTKLLLNESQCSTIGGGTLYYQPVMNILDHTKEARQAAPRYTRRVQTVLTERQYELLLKLAEEEGKPVSAMVREAVEAQYLKNELHKQRQQALQDLFSLEAPVGAWEEMEKEIIDGALGD